MNKQIHFKQTLLLASTLFGLLFGAGNLIFPIHMGQEAGQQVGLANLGFLITGIGLPLLAIIVMGLTNSRDIIELASPIHPGYAKFFTILLYLCIGPLFAVPRLASTSYEIGFASWLPAESSSLYLPFFSIAFFLCTWWFSQNPTKLIDYIGKYMNPLFLTLLAILFALAIIFPMGNPGDIRPLDHYQAGRAFSQGLVQGYSTLDAPAGLAFGILIIRAVKSMGIDAPGSIARQVIKAGLLTALMMGLIYSLLSLMGASSVTLLGVQENGGLSLALISKHYLGSIGASFLSLIILLACLKTAIGLTTAFGETFHDLFPKISYPCFTAIACILPTIIANLGLSKITQYTLPILMFIYPLTITLTLLGLGSYFLGYHPPVYIWVTLMTGLAALIDALNALPDFIRQEAWIENLVSAASQLLPFYQYGLGWILPALVGLLIGAMITFQHKKIPRN